MRIVHKDEAEDYLRAWQAKLREAKADLGAGRVRRFGCDEDFLAHLEAIDHEAG